MSRKNPKRPKLSGATKGEDVMEVELRKVKEELSEVKKELIKAMEEQSKAKKELCEVKEELSKAKKEQSMAKELPRKVKELRDVKELLTRITRKHDDLAEKLRDRVKCPVCLEVPSNSPVYACSNGHVVCVSCVRAKCSVCRTGMVLHNNILAVTVMENIDHQCKDCKLCFSLEDLA